MKRSFRLWTVILGVVFALGCGALIACGGDEQTTQTPSEPPVKSCFVQVDGGSGSGYYYVDTNCTVKAEVPAGKQFIKWTAGTTDLSANEEYTFTVTGNIKLTAVFADDIPDVALYEINVHWGLGSGKYFAGTKVTLSVLQEYVGATFTGWEATYKGADGSDVTKIISTDSTYELTVDKSMNITAAYDATPLVTPDNSKGQMFHISDNGAYELDRQKTEGGGNKTAFVEGCAFLLYTAYEKDEDDVMTVVGQGKVVPVPKEGEYYHYMYSMDGTIGTGLKGGNGNIYQDVSDALTKIRTILNVESNKTYYITVRAMGGDDTPIDSAESDAFAVKF